MGASCNVNWERFPDDLAGSATSCNLEAGHPVDRDELLVAFLGGFAAFLGQGGGVVDEYRARLATLGRRVRVEPVRGDPLLGTAVDVTGNGALVVRDDAGTDHTVATADVIHLRRLPPSCASSVVPAQPSKRAAVRSNCSSATRVVLICSPSIALTPRSAASASRSVAASDNTPSGPISCTATIVVPSAACARAIGAIGGRGGLSSGPG